MGVDAHVWLHGLLLAVICGAKLVRKVERSLVPRSLNLVSKVIERGVVVKSLIHAEGLCRGVEGLARGGELAQLARVLGVRHGKSLGERLDGRGLLLDVLHLELSGQTLGERLGHVLAAHGAGDVLAGLAGPSPLLDDLEEVGVVEEGRHGVDLAEEPGVVPQVERLARVVDLHAILAHALAQGVVQARALHEHLRVLARESHSEELLLDGVLKV